MKQDILRQGILGRRLRIHLESNPFSILGAIPVDEEFRDCQRDLSRALASGKGPSGLPPAVWAYSRVQNMAAIMAETLLDLPEMEPLAALWVRTRTDFPPSLPPDGPIYPSYIEIFSLFDLWTGSFRETTGALLGSLGEHLRLDPDFLRLLDLLNQSRLGIYHCEEIRNGRPILREIATGRLESPAISSGYVISQDEILLIRILPPPGPSFGESVILSTPFVLVSPGLLSWKYYVGRASLPFDAESGTPSEAYRTLMKFGKKWSDWPKFIVRAHLKSEEDAVFLSGLPDVPGSLPARSSPQRRSGRETTPKGASSNSSPLSCEDCGADPGRFGVVLDGSRLCRACSNASIARSRDMIFRDRSFPPEILPDAGGVLHTFHFASFFLVDRVFMEAVEEKKRREEEGYRWEIMTFEPDPDLGRLHKELMEKIERDLMRTHIEDGGHGGISICREGIVRGRISSDRNQGFRTPLLVIDGKPIDWDEFGRMLSEWEGSHFTLEIHDKFDLEGND